MTARTMPKGRRVRHVGEMDPDQPGNYRVRRIPRVDRIVWRYRYQLVPVVAGFAAWAMVLGLARSVFWSALVALGVIALAQHRGRRLRTAEQAYAAVALGAGLVWAVVVHLAGVHGWGVLAWAALVAAGGVPWWRHRRVRSRIKLDRTLRAWPETAARAGLKDVKAVSVAQDGDAEVLRLELPRGKQTVGEVSARLTHLAQVLGEPERALRLVPDQHDPARVDLVIVRGDPFRDKGKTRGAAVDLVHPAIADPTGWAALARTIRHPLPYGRTQTGGPAQLALWTEQGGRIVAVVAKKGGGKSVTINDLLAALAPCRDVRIIGIDIPKRGATLGAWEDRLHRLAVTPTAGIDALHEVYDLLGDRGQTATTPVHQPTPDDPAYVVVVEEMGATVERYPEIGDLLGSIGRLVRAGGVSLLLVDQRPDHTTWPGVLRSNVDDVLAGRMGRRGDSKLVLFGHTQVDLTAIPEDMPGQMVQQVGTTGPVVPLRSWRLEQPPHIAAIVAASLAVVSLATVRGPEPVASRSTSTPRDRRKGHRTTAADARARVEAAVGSLEQDQAGRQPVRGDLATLTRDHVSVEPDPRPGDDVLDRTLLRLVGHAGADGIGVADLVRAAETPRATVQRRLGALRRAGHLDLRPERGPSARWYTTQSEPSRIA